jgi:hypothetical protein
MEPTGQQDQRLDGKAGRARTERGEQGHRHGGVYLSKACIDIVEWMGRIAAAQKRDLEISPAQLNERFTQAI